MEILAIALGGIGDDVSCDNAEKPRIIPFRRRLIEDLRQEPLIDTLQGRQVVGTANGVENLNLQPLVAPTKYVGSAQRCHAIRQIKSPLRIVCGSRGRNEQARLVHAPPNSSNLTPYPKSASLRRRGYRNLHPPVAFGIFSWNSLIQRAAQHVAIQWRSSASPQLPRPQYHAADATRHYTPMRPARTSAPKISVGAATT
ncbi:hypothetical protein ABIB76_006313 [Bradyrhizobium sp. i1.12.3]